MSSDSIRYEEYRNFDINWYFVDRHQHLICVASGGGRLPAIISESISRNDAIHSSVLSSDPLFEPLRNPRLGEYINLSEIDLEQYYSSFDFVASRGFYAFDKINLNNSEHGEYVLVSYPNRTDFPDSYFLSPHLPYLVLSLARNYPESNYAKSLVKIPVLDIQIIGKKGEDKLPWVESRLNLIDIVDAARVLYP